MTYYRNVIAANFNNLVQVMSCYGVVTPKQKRKRFRSRYRGKMGSVPKKLLSLGVAGKLDNISNKWSDLTFAFAFALVWLDH